MCCSMKSGFYRKSTTPNGIFPPRNFQAFPKATCTRRDLWWMVTSCWCTVRLFHYIFWRIVVTTKRKKRCLDEVKKIAVCAYTIYQRRGSILIAQQPTADFATNTAAVVGPRATQPPLLQHFCNYYLRKFSTTTSLLETSTKRFPEFKDFRVEKVFEKLWKS